MDANERQGLKLVISFVRVVLFMLCAGFVLVAIAGFSLLPPSNPSYNNPFSENYRSAMNDRGTMNLMSRTGFPWSMASDPLCKTSFPSVDFMRCGTAVGAGSCLLNGLLCWALAWWLRRTYLRLEIQVALPDESENPDDTDDTTESPGPN